MKFKYQNFDHGHVVKSITFKFINLSVKLCIIMNHRERERERKFIF